MRSPAAARRRPPARRPPTLRPQAAVNRAGPGHPQASHRPLQLELFGDGRARKPRQPLSLRPQGRQPEPFPHLAPAPSPASQKPSRDTCLPGIAAKPEAIHAELFRRLSRLIGGRLRTLWLTDNRRTILSVRSADRAQRPPRLPRPSRPPCPPRPPRPPRQGQGRFQSQGQGAPIDLRIHRSFAAAPDPVLRAVAVFLASAKGSATARQALAAIREHFHLHRPDPRALPAAAPGKARRPSLCPVGEVLDLREIAGDLNQRYFEGRLKVRITWGKSAGESGHPASDCRRTRTTSLQLGSYSYEDRLIRVHRVLDRPEVPRYVVESVVFHELLHADLPPVMRNGRRYFHTPEFRRRERKFRHFERADCWVRQNLQQLLRARREAAGQRRRRS
jgi:hypothetical protein